MKHYVLTITAVLFAVACADSGRLPFEPSVGFNAVHGEIAAPAVSWASTTLTDDDPVDLYSVAFDFEWNDVYPELNFNHVSFDLLRSTSSSGPFVEVATENGGSSNPYGAQLTDTDVEEGTYWYCGKVMAKDKDTSPQLTYHSTCSTPIEVVVGQTVVYTFVRIAAQNNSTETAAPGPLALSKTGNITVFLVLKADGTLVNDCTTVDPSDVTASIQFTTVPAGPFNNSETTECAYNGSSNRYVYKVTLPNAGISPAPNNGGSIDFKINGSTVTTYNFTTS